MVNLSALKCEDLLHEFTLASFNIQLSDIAYTQHMTDGHLQAAHTMRSNVQIVPINR